MARQCGQCCGVALVSRIDKLQVSFAKEPYERDDILQKRPVNLSILLTVATPCLLHDRAKTINTIQILTRGTIRSHTCAMTNMQTVLSAACLPCGAAGCRRGFGGGYAENSQKSAHHKCTV